MELIKDIMQYGGRLGDIFCGNRFWEKKYRVYVPEEEWPELLYCIHSIGFDYYQAEREAPLLRKRIIDEDQPLKMKMPIRTSGFLSNEGGRIYDAILLGLIKHSEACHELLEASAHDLSYEMRASSVNALGDIGREASSFAGGVSNIMLNDRKLFVRGQAARALGKIGNPASVKYLRQAFEDGRSLVREYHREHFVEGKKESFNDLIDAAMLLEDSIISIFRLDPKQGSEVVAEGMGDENNSVYHFSKSAAFRAGCLKPSIVLAKRLPLRKP